MIGRRGGKSVMAINEIIKRSVQSPGLYWFICPSYKQAKAIAWRLLKYYLKPDPDWNFNEVELKAEHPHIKTVIELKGADNEDSLRGVSVKGVVLDECATMKANVWPEIIRPMLADAQGWALFIGTPKGKNWFYEQFQNEIRDPENWQSFKHSTTINKYIKAEEIELARKDMSERLFRQEFMADFMDDETGVFRRVKQCAVGQLKLAERGQFYVIGADLGKHMDFTVLTVMDPATREVVAFKRFKDVSWPDQKEAIQKLALEYNNAKVIVDATGVGDAIFDDLSNANISVEAFKFTNSSKHQLVEKLSVSIEQRLITFPNIEELVSELQSFEYEITADGRIKYSAPDGKHDDCVMSLALANWGIRHDLYATRAQMKAQDDFALIDRIGHGHNSHETEYMYATEPNPMVEA